MGTKEKMVDPKLRSLVKYNHEKYYTRSSQYNESLENGIHFNKLGHIKIQKIYSSSQLYCHIIYIFEINTSFGLSRMGTFVYFMKNKITSLF